MNYVSARYCLGANLAVLEIKMFIATLVRRVASLELTADKVEWNPSTMIPRPLDGAKVRVRANF
jgi:cytochrome P450